MSKLTLYVVIACQSLLMSFASGSMGQRKHLEEIPIELKIGNGEMLLSKLISQIEANNQFQFAYSKSDVKGKSIILSKSNYNMQELLEEVSTQAKFSIRRVNETIALITLKDDVKPSFVEELDALQQLVSGTITDENNDPLPGATVLEKGTSNGTITDVNGKFQLNVNDQSILSISFVGFQPLEVPVNGRSVIDVSLENDISSLEEVVVVGYGSVKKSDLTGSVASISSDELTAYPTVDAIQAMQGRTAGLQISSTNGEPGSDYLIRIRGASSINASSDPIIVVDGFVGGVIPPADDIASVEILKDASATAIYGSRGANGVIIITTKKGKAGKARINVNTSYSIQKDINRLEVLNAAEYIQYFEDLGAPLPNTEIGIADTDWQDEILRTGAIQNYQISVSGGSEKVNYYLSGVYYDNKGIIVNSHFDRISIQGNVNVNPIDRLKIGSNFLVYKSTKDGIRTQTLGGVQEGPIMPALRYNPTIPVYNPDGSYGMAVVSSDNPYALAVERVDEQVIDRTQINTYAELEILDDLSFRTTIGSNTVSTRRGGYVPTTLYWGGSEVGGSATYSTGRNTNLLSENYFTYNKEIGNMHELTLVAGYSYQINRWENSFLSGSSFISDAVSYWSIGSAEIPGVPNNSYRETELSSYYGRLNYSLMDRYLFTFTARRDGSSTFSANNKWAFFPSGAFAWNIKNEPFLSGLSIVSQLKLRASYGKTGNQAISPYQTLATLSFTPAVQNGSVVNAVRPTNVANNELTWETTTQTDIGVDFGVFDNRVEVIADYYNKRTDDLLFSVPLPQYSGYTTQLANIGTVENKGVELALNTKNIVGKFNWNSNFNISFNRNKILELPDGEDILYNSGSALVGTQNTAVLREGQPVGVFYGFVFDGVYQEGDTFIPGSGFDQAAGGAKYLDFNGRDAEGELTGLPDTLLNNDDRTIVGNPHPDFIWGFTNNFSFMGFDLNIFIQGSQGNDIYSYTLMDLSRNSYWNGLKDRWLNQWTPENTDTNIPAASPSNPVRSSSEFVFDGSYIRFKNISLGYNFPKSMLSKAGIEALRVYVSGQNLITITNYPGVDPEVNYNTGSAEDRNKNLGLDYASYPNNKSVTFGLNLEF